ncbi:MAG TPA: sensor histidine kinase [Caulobacteraceae bacterium]|nr:sensor histidine kinase [Caulobacteraceae bacterium]
MPINRWMAADPGETAHASRLSELHHRIANNLALIASYARLKGADIQRTGKPLSAAEARALLDSVGLRIEATARLNRLLSHDPEQSRIDLGELLAASCAAVRDTIGLEAVDIRCRCQAGVVDWRIAETLGMIVTELVINAIKYAHPAGAPGRIEVACREHPDGRLEVSVADDGVGLPEGFDPAADGGLGMRVVRSLARQMDAEVRVANHGLGLTIRVAVPADRPSGALDRAAPPVEITAAAC